ncbi:MULTISPECIES: FMNH-dependent EDTA monooxygenase EmoA [Chelativorans]|uniref:EDTA monooxygenase n=5 Tax=Pseudomonadota TaxID=1224 RepID=Q9F9T3_9PROT|nr:MULTISPECIES: FMNH-dependent EDTA monooxygenase EmoA [Chelativorans]AAG09252.1 EDTA monooxygenase [EDTA-degrading bacterium BNC1]5DQP_A Chain A, EDTA monooxygenase [EDTA-degrading bacterium BNC1]5DQP_B Chain B, EDTA monooxygenase [EDTA-degrading bacterium BNC1]HRD76750.1 FMNH-dependent EDTA monooxygenase EmoA [Hyphomicrobiaceae bacterium]
MRKRRMYLVSWLNSSGVLPNSWNEGRGNRARIFDLENYIRSAEIARRGRIDAFFLADQPQLTPNPKVRPEYPFDPIVLAAAITGRVPDIGGIVTASTSFSLPYTLARQIASVNLLSGGRIGWNAVTTANPAVAANYGAAIATHDNRYERAEEFLEVVHGLWNSWKFPWDEAIGPNPNPFGEVMPINHEGKYFKVAGPLNVPLPPYGPPVVVQAGGSDQGKRLASRFGEIIYAFLGSKPAGRRFVAEARAAARAQGRPEGSTLVLPSFVPLIGSTEAEVKRLVAEYEAGLDPAEQRIEALSKQLGIDLERINVDQVLQEKDFNLPKESATPIGILKSMVDVALDEKLSLRQLALRMRLIAGTPDQVADRLIDWWQDEAADGFVINAPLLPDALEIFVDQVVPILQSRGVFPRSYTESTLRERLGLPRNPLG